LQLAGVSSLIVCLLLGFYPRCGFFSVATRWLAQQRERMKVSIRDADFLALQPGTGPRTASGYWFLSAMRIF